MEPLLVGRHLMVVEDEPLLAFDLVDLLESHGGRAVGPYQSLGDAIAAVDRGDRKLDCAILDINLGPDMVWPLVDKLEAQGTPYFFVSAVCGSEMPSRYAARTCLKKPVCKDEFQRALIATIDR